VGVDVKAAVGVPVKVGVAVIVEVLMGVCAGVAVVASGAGARLLLWMILLWLPSVGMLESFTFHETARWSLPAPSFMRASM
jgi:hypothetical protein